MRPHLGVNRNWIKTTYQSPSGKEYNPFIIQPKKIGLDLGLSLEYRWTSWTLGAELGYESLYLKGSNSASIDPYHKYSIYKSTLSPKFRLFERFALGPSFGFVSVHYFKNNPSFHFLEARKVKKPSLRYGFALTFSPVHSIEIDAVFHFKYKDPFFAYGVIESYSPVEIVEFRDQVSTLSLRFAYLFPVFHK